MWGICNVLINGEKHGMLIFHEGKIHAVCLVNDAEYASWFGIDMLWVNGGGCEAYPAGIDMHVHDRWGEPEREGYRYLFSGYFNRFFRKNKFC